eukprot:CAMPEP_0115592282 /NCGR_PEP_ID=MMETSP0272-20121206/10709_1 /TAXON_ID=71861 /ORGANISM="Scrippsiella trochoidea, Strain CCMP3099" /LENGTH=69 /DNA_ID=CAMNT_0003027523 /DNA_START=414 /DNA_END=619 /DNA_ORIENTATION=-
MGSRYETVEGALEAVTSAVDTTTATTARAAWLLSVITEDGMKTIIHMLPPRHHDSPSPSELAAHHDEQT